MKGELRRSLWRLNQNTGRGGEQNLSKVTASRGERVEKVPIQMTVIICYWWLITIRFMFCSLFRFKKRYKLWSCDPRGRS